MLVLTRKVQQSVVIGGDAAIDRLLKVTVIRIGTQRIKLGFEVPLDIPVHRFELWQAIQVAKMHTVVPEVDRLPPVALLREFPS